MGGLVLLPEGREPDHLVVHLIARHPPEMVAAVSLAATLRAAMSGYTGPATLIQDGVSFEVTARCEREVDARSGLGSWWGAVAAPELIFKVSNDLGEAELRIGDRTGSIILAAANVRSVRLFGEWRADADVIFFVGSGTEPF